MKNNKSPYLRPRRVFAISIIALLLVLGVAVVVTPTGSSAAPANVSNALSFCTTDPVVANNLDDGPGSLRQAIADACDGSTITFNMATVTSPISLTTAQLTIEKNLTITGPGSTSLTIERSAAPATPKFRIFDLPLPFVTINISGLTVTNGHGADSVPVGDIGGTGEYGGGIRNFGSLTMTDVRLIGNHAGNGVPATRLGGDGGRGGGIYNEGSVLTLTNCVVSGNRSGDGALGGSGGGGRAGEGSGIYTRAGTATLTNVIISNNTGGLSPTQGGFGGIGAFFIGVNTTVVTMNSCVVSNNIAGDATGIDGTPGLVGGIWNEGQLTITNSTISGNVSKEVAGALINRSTAILRLTNSTLSGNSSVNGSAITNDTDGLVFLTNCTITNNFAQGVAVWATSPTVEVRNTIIAGNEGDRDVFGTFTSRGNNLIGNSDFSSGFTNGVNNDQVGSSVSPLNPRLGPLANNGGPSQTHALLGGSPALDGGNNCVLNNTCPGSVGILLTTDQRGPGFPRAADSGDANLTQTVDIGAYEAQISVEHITNKSDAGRYADIY